MGIKKSAGLWLALFFLLTLTGCNRLKSVDERTDLALSRAEQAGFETHQFDFQGFSIRSFSRLTKPDLPLHVHVEGDGRAYIAPWRISANPTPIHPVSLDLALSDDSANVIYLARPCQFLTI
ncbi:MAG: alpha/beta hydrolase, partial [Gammaproteobacteria bacterium]